MTKVTPLEILEFIVTHYKRAKDWDKPSLYNWICWNLENGFCLLVGDKSGLTGLAFVRTMMMRDSATQKTGLHFDPEGDTYFVDLAIAKAPKLPVLQALGFAGHKRFGQRDYIAFQRHGKGSVMITNAKRHRDRILRMTLKT